MSDLNTTDNLFFARTELDHSRVDGILQDTLRGADDGELFLEYRQSESVAIDDGKIKSALSTQRKGLDCVQWPMRRQDMPTLLS